VWSGARGWYPHFNPKHARKDTNMTASLTTAFQEYMADVQSGTFPAEENSFPMDESLLEGL